MAAGPTARTFAKALFYAAVAQGRLDAVRADLAALRALVGAVPAFATFLRLRALGAARRLRALHDVLDGRADPVTLDGLLLMERRGALGLLPRMADTFEQLWARHAGRRRARVTAARPLDPGQLARLRARLAARLGAAPEALETEAATDPELLGGFTVQVEDTFYDYSLAGRLARLRRQLARAG